MHRIGIRELRQNASVYLERVKSGESIEVTERGVPIAVLSPAPVTSLIDRLVAEGKVVEPRSDIRDWLSRNPAVLAAAHHPTLSETIAAFRDDDDR
jgi:prevent-host-death family protein